MPRLGHVAVLCSLFTQSLFSFQSQSFVGRWDFNLQEANGKPAASWLGIKEASPGKLTSGGNLTGGHVIQIPDYKLEGSQLTLNLPRGMSWDLQATEDQLTGKQTKGGATIPLTGMRAPELKGPAPHAWTEPRKLFDGKDLNGWTPIGDTANSHWVVQNGDLLNEKHGANLKSSDRFNDFKLHFEVNCPDEANSGFYLRGRYELQLEYEKAGTEPPERSMAQSMGELHRA